MTGLLLPPITHQQEAGTSCCDNEGMKWAEWTFTLVSGAWSGGLFHIVTYLSGRLNKNFSGLFVQCDTRGCVCTSTLWAIKPFNGLNAVHKTPHCVWIYSLNCNTRRKGGEEERARMRKHVHTVCTRGGCDSVRAEGIRAYKLFTFCTMYSAAHCSLSSGLSSLLKPGAAFEQWIMGADKLIGCCFATPRRSRYKKKNKKTKKLFLKVDDVEINKKKKWKTLFPGCAATKVWREAAVCSFCLQPVNAVQINLSPEIRSHGFALFDTLGVKSKHPFGRQVGRSEPNPVRLAFPQTCSTRLVLTAIKARTWKRNIWMWFQGLIVSMI